jgi:hypothetical protein
LAGAVVSFTVLSIFEFEIYEMSLGDGKHRSAFHNLQRQYANVERLIEARQYCAATGNTVSDNRM